jgi:membrane protease subunit (stomatin/prohibitin family)
MALFVDEGRVADLFSPGTHTIRTRNLPVLTDLRNWDKGFESPFKSDVYFFSTRLRLNQTWGTANPLTIRDREFGAVRLRGFGAYAYRIADPRVFFVNVSGTRDAYAVADLEGQLRSTIISTLTDHLGESQVPFMDMAANQDELARAVMQKARTPFAELGLALEAFQIQNLSLPDELQKRLDERIGMGIVGDLSRYTQFQVAQSIPTAASAPGGAAGAGVGLGAGIAMGQAMSQVIGQPPHPPAAGSAPGPTSPTPAPSAPGHGTVCARCETPLDRPGKFCPECGAPLA